MAGERVSIHIAILLAGNSRIASRSKNQELNIKEGMAIEKKPIEKKPNEEKPNEENPNDFTPIINSTYVDREKGDEFPSDLISKKVRSIIDRLTLKYSSKDNADTNVYGKKSAQGR